MRTFRVKTLISVSVVSVLAMSTGLPAHAQTVAIAAAAIVNASSPASAGQHGDSGQHGESGGQRAAASSRESVGPAETETSDQATDAGKVTRSAEAGGGPVGDSDPLKEATASAVTAADAALSMANTLDGAGGGVSGDDLMSALEDAAAAGQPLAMWRLGTMYENGDGVAKDPVKAFSYFSQIANDHADVAPKSLEADIVAQSFVKIGDYYHQGLPGPGIQVDEERSKQLVLYAATYFGDPDAQYRVGEIYLTDKADANPLQGARWLALAAHKGHAPAQAKLGNLLFNGDGIAAQPVEGLMWLTIAHDHSEGTADETWINELLNRAMSVANADERAQATKMADKLGPRFSPR
ncbi:MAG: hypothetical protein JWN11_1936 [Hyphomicrobiales bacterium]|nr:hypothetical protein [Hyphomicrobiales bacterium]